MLNSTRSDARRFVATALGLSLGLVLVALGCGDDKTNGSGSNPRFDPDEVTIVVGDTIRFVAVSGDHTVTSGTGSNDPNSGLLFDADLPEGDTFTRVFNSQGTIRYYCVPHEADGMDGTITVAAVSPKTVGVTASGIAFTPRNIQINLGDAVRWTAAAQHTVTSGTGESDPNMGVLFDESLLASQTFTFTFTAVGVFDYFCQFHGGTGMTGTVTVVALTAKTVVVEALE